MEADAAFAWRKENPDIVGYANNLAAALRGLAEAYAIPLEEAQSKSRRSQAENQFYQAMRAFVQDKVKDQFNDERLRSLAGMMLERLSFESLKEMTDFDCHLEIAQAILNAVYPADVEKVRQLVMSIFNAPKPPREGGRTVAGLLQRQPPMQGPELLPRSGLFGRTPALGEPTPADPNNAQPMPRRRPAYPSPAPAPIPQEPQRGGNIFGRRPAVEPVQPPAEKRTDVFGRRKPAEEPLKPPESSTAKGLFGRRLPNDDALPPAHRIPIVDKDSDSYLGIFGRSKDDNEAL